MKKILIPATLLCIGLIHAQQPANKASLPNIIPPSPTAYALGNYGNVPIGLFTGSPNISVPLLTYKAGNIDLPFSLSYSSSGVKVDEISTNVGLGWNLNFGGVITRMVRDRADEVSTHITVPDPIKGGYNDPVTNNFLLSVGNSSDALDTEADLYSFNFNGYSGKFFYDQANQPHIIDQQAVKIERTGNTNGDGQDFLLTVPTGEKYYFTEKERTIYRSIGSGHSVPSSAITAWYLTKVEHPDGDEVYLNYSANTIPQYIGSQSQTLRMSVGYPSSQNYCVQQGGGTTGRYAAPSTGEIIDNTIEISGKRIASITSNNIVNGSIVFEYETDILAMDVEGNKKVKAIQFLDKNGGAVESISFDYLNTINKRNFLSSIKFKDPQKKYGFEYENPTEFPERLSKKQDHWGYFNDALGSSAIVPKDVPEYGFVKLNYGGADRTPNPIKSKLGMLKKIIYPTKGYTELDYEGNTFWGEKTIYPNLYTKKLEIKTDNQTNDNTVEYTFTSTTDQKVNINASLLGNGVQGCSSFISSGHIAGTLEVKGIPYDLTRDNSSHNISINVLAGETLTVKIRADFYCSKVKADISYYQTAPQTFFTNLETGGVRVKSVKDADGIGQVVYKRYYYAHKDDISKSSGHKGNDPYFVDVDSWQIACYGAPGSGNTGSGCTSIVENSDLVLSSSSLISLYDTGTMSCLYPFVTISEGGDNFENGGEMKEFKVKRDSGPHVLWGPGIISFSPWTNSGWDNGTELKSLVLRKNPGSSTLDIIQEKESIYEKNDAAAFELKNFTGRMLFNYACGGSIPAHPYGCTAEDVLKPNTLCSGKAPGTSVNLPDIENLSVMEYRNISYWHYLKSQKTTDYSEGIPVKTETEYFYNNPSHYQLSRQKTTFPDGRIGETAYSYAHEKGNQLMIGRNMVGIPLETVTGQTVNGNTKTISKTETVYPVSLPTTEAGNLILPQAEKYYDIPNNTVNTEIKYGKYDTNGNILQYTEKTGTPVAFVWGYGRTQPIAQIEGISYDQLAGSGLISSIVSASDNDASNPDSEAALISALDAFRTHSSLRGYKITTFSYDLLKGVTSVTPPSGIREVYIYDVYGRLKEIRENDKNGNILKEYNYNFKP